MSIQALAAMYAKKVKAWRLLLIQSNHGCMKMMLFICNRLNIGWIIIFSSTLDNQSRCRKTTDLRESILLVPAISPPENELEIRVEYELELELEII